MTTQNRFPVSGVQIADNSQRPEPYNAEPPAKCDWDSLIGLLMMVGSTSLAAVSMVVDVSALREAFKVMPESPLENHPQIAEQSILHYN